MYKVNSWKVLIESLILGATLTLVSYVIAFLFGWVTTTPNWLEAFSVFTSYSCTYMCVKQSRWNYPMGAISVASLSYLFWTQGLFASAALNAYLVPVLAYGWFRWRADTVTRPVTYVSPAWWPAYIGGAFVLWITMFNILQNYDATLPATDSVILIGSILAQFLLDNKKLETWFIWAIVNIFAIYTYAEAGLSLVALQFVFFLANTVWGWYDWNKSMKTLVKAKPMTMEIWEKGTSV